MSRSTLTELIVAEIVGEHGYRPSSVSVDRLAFARSFRPTWATVLGIVFGITGIGLFLLLVRSTETFSVSISEDHTGIAARIHGRVHPDLLDRLEVLAGSRSSGSVPRQALPANSLFSSSLPPQSMTSDQQFQPQPAFPPAHFGPQPLPYVEPIQGIGAQSPAPTVASPPPSPWLLATPSIPNPTVLPDELTRAAPRSPAKTPEIVRPINFAPVIRFDDGRTVPVTSFVLLGRDPEQGSEDPRAQLVVVDDQTVSKTHAALGVDEAGLWLVDRHSTNGTSILSSDGGISPALPDTVVRVAVGSWIRLGTRTLQIEAAS